MSTLRVGQSRRHLVREDGSAFFYLADTAWELFHRLDREDAVHYLDRRSAQGFSVIQAVGLAELEGLKLPNAYGELPVVRGDLGRPNDAYWDHVEWVVARAAERGLVTALLPCWGDKVYPKWNEVKPLFTAEKAFAFGGYLAKRLGKYPLIWVLGGDRPVETVEHRRVWGSMAAALKAGSPHPVSYHPVGQASSSAYFHGEPWLDFNMIQSGHMRRDLPVEQMVLRDLTLQPPKPTIESEVNYEDHPIAWDPSKGWFDDYDVRTSAYRAVFSGSAGYAYGCHDVWQFWAPTREAIAFARTPWKEALELPGAGQLVHLRKLIESVPWMEMRANPAFALCYPEEGPGERAACLATADERCVLLYVPRAKKLTWPSVTTSAYRRYWWRVMDCRNGEWTGRERLTKEGVRWPSEGEREDFVLEVTSEPSGAFEKVW